MQVVGDFICIGANQRTLYFVDGPVEGVQADRAKLAGESFLQLGVEIFPEAAAASNQVFPLARLALVDACLGAACQRSTVQFHPDALFVHCMA